MTHDVFVSYSTKDKAVADAIVAALENNDVRCWYAPRDVKPGTDWGEEIVKAIASSKVFLLIFSESANHSQRVLDELNLAITKEATILPFRIENLDPRGAMQLHLSTRHWLDAFSPSWEKHIDKLVKAVKLNLAGSEMDEVFENIGVKSTKKKKNNWLLPAIAAMVLVGFGLIYGLPLLSQSGSSADQSVQIPTEIKPTSEPLGSPDNPIVWTFAVPPGVEFDQVNTAAKAITEKFSEMNPGMVMKAIPASSLKGAYDGICNGNAQVAYLDAFTYLRRDEDDCPIEARLIWHAYEDINFGGAIYLSQNNQDIQSLTDLKGKVLCIPGYQSTSGWILPSLELRASVGDPADFFGEVIDTGSHDEVIKGLYDGSCDVGTAYYDVRENMDLPNLMNKVTIFATTIPSPNTNLSFRTDMDESLLNTLVSFFKTVSTEDNNLAIVNGTTAENTAIEMIEINDFYFNDLRDLLEQAGASSSEYGPVY